jgi:hypothetical protein
VADVGAWTAAATACAAAIGTVIAAVRQPADVATLRGEVKTAREEAPIAIREAVSKVAALIDPQLRADINALAKRLADLEDWRKRIRERDRDRSPETQRGPATSGPDLLAATDVEHARRIAHLEARADRVDTALADAREKLAGILATVQSILALRGGP